MTREVIFSPEARKDIRGIYLYIATHGAPNRALAYIEKIEACCRDLATFPERGTRRDDLRPELRIMGMERRVTIAFTVGAERVIILRVLYAGQSLERAFET